jgi:Tol biopolymer transport system component
MRVRQKSTIVGAVLAMLAALAVLAAPALATFPGSNGKIAFSSFTPSVNHGCIYTVEPDGTGATPVTTCNPDHNEVHPAWNADGRRLAYGLLDEDGKIMAITDGGAPTAIAFPGMNATGLSWSPDGSKLATSLDGGSSTGLFVLDVAGGGFTKIVDDVSGGVDWSPDGSRIAFNGIETVAPDGTGRTFVTIGGHPSWSPDGTKLAFVSNGDIWLSNPDGTGQVNLTDSPSDFRSGPEWSPDGTKIAFSSRRDGVQPCGEFSVLAPCADIYVMNADGTGEVNLTNTPTVDETFPAWQPVRGPRPADYKNRSAFCRAERDFLGDQEFGAKYGTNGNGANAFGKCVSAR